MITDRDESAWKEWVYESCTYDSMLRAFRIAVDAAIPDAADLVGDEIHVLSRHWGTATELSEEIRQRIDSTDLAAIAEKHAPTGAHPQE